MPISIDCLPQREVMPGFLGRFLHTGASTLVFWEVAAGAVLPEHAHVHVQTTQVLEGIFEMHIDGEMHTCQPGSICVIPSGIRHGGKALSACRLLDTFSPEREDYR